MCKTFLCMHLHKADAFKGIQDIHVTTSCSGNQTQIFAFIGIDMFEHYDVHCQSKVGNTYSFFIYFLSSF